MMSRQITPLKKISKSEASSNNKDNLILFNFVISRKENCASVSEKRKTRMKSTPLHRHKKAHVLLKEYSW